MLVAEACPNCGKPVLPGDTVCWHCGYTLPKRPKARPAEAPREPASVRARARGDTTAEEAADYDLRALAVYGALTLAIVLSLWLVMRALGRQPILVRSAGPDFNGQWMTVTDAELRYTLSLPSDWQWFDAAYRGQTALLPDVIARQPYVDRALRPLGEAAGDVEILAVAADTPNLDDPQPVAFAVVGRSARLATIDPQAALDLVGEQELPVSETGIDTHLAGQPQARFNVLDLPNAYHCRHLFTADGAAAYLIAACAPQSSYGTRRHELDDILGSFQLLQN